MALNRADDLWLSRRLEDDPSWVYWMPQPSWTAEAGAALLGIGDPAAAERSLLAGAADLGDDSPRDLVIYQARLAQVQMRAGRLDEAAVTARDAAAGAAGTFSVRVAGEVDRLMGSLVKAGGPTAAG